jgi:hypothetical protein
MTDRAESSIEKALVKWAKNRGWESIKFTPRGDRAWPDRIFIWTDGTHVWMELKKAGETPSKHQLYKIGKMRDRNMNVTWTDNLHGAQMKLVKYETN